MLATAREVARLPIDAIKIHNLYAVRGTPLGEQVSRGEVQLMSRTDYVRTVVDFLEVIRPETIVERVSGEAPPDYLLAPDWCLDKVELRRALQDELLRRDTWQGRCFQAS
jgi:radical SAM superfamily enzyme